MGVAGVTCAFGYPILPMRFNGGGNPREGCIVFSKLRYTNDCSQKVRVIVAGVPKDGPAVAHTALTGRHLHG